MKKLKAIIFCTILLSLTGCWNSTWTEEERKTFKTKCESQILFDVNPIFFTGFTLDEIDTIMAIEKDKNKIIDTVYFYPQQERSELQKFSSSPNVQFNINHSYEFYLDSNTPYVLDNMEMIMWSQNTMTGEDWGCVMGNFTIDNEKFEHRGNISFNKRK